MDVVMTADFWIDLFKIILINIVLSGDNAVVIALASRSLPAKQQKQAIIFGSIGAIVLRIILTFFAVVLLGQPYLKLVGAALLLSRGDWSVLVTRPLSASLLAAALALIVIVALPSIKAKREEAFVED